MERVGDSLYLHSEGERPIPDLVLSTPYCFDIRARVFHKEGTYTICLARHTTGDIPSSDRFKSVIVVYDVHAARRALEETMLGELGNEMNVFPQPRLVNETPINIPPHIAASQYGVEVN